uniref:Bm10912, isoform b n=1 Tax=Brugia malayi TaxID=6279 RepID=A0A1I9G4L8_BRUMA|nr:Bm10912, isoform b [Brugia malayi]
MDEVKALKILDRLSHVNIDNPDLATLSRNGVLLDRSLYSLPDCAVRRRFFSIVECFLISLWQKSCFGYKHLGEETHHVVSVFGILKDIVLEICFSADTVWFGGEQLCLKTNPLNNAIVFLSCCWHAAALVINICNTSEIQDLLKTSTRLIPQHSCLSIALLTQDERCLSTAVAFLRMETAEIDTPPQLKAMRLFRHTLFSIAYDHKVILDWLYSEFAAVPFVLRLLKMLIKQQKDDDKQQYSSFSCLQCNERNKKTRFIRSKTISSGDGLTLCIQQLHGDLPVTTSYTFSKIEREVCLMVPEPSEEESGDQQIVKCFENLRASCIRLQNSGDAPFNVMPIIRIIEQLRKAVKKSDTVLARKCSHRNYQEANMTELILDLELTYLGDALVCVVEVRCHVVVLRVCEFLVARVVLTMSSSGSDRHRSKSHSPRSERSDSRSNTPPRRRSRSRSVDRAAEQLGRLHICNFDESLRKDDLKDAFGKFGDIDNVWLASYPPLFAFVTFKAKEDAVDALKEMNNAYIGRNKIKVATAHPPRKPGERGPPRRYGGGGYRGGGGPRSYGGYGSRGGGYGGGGYGGRSGSSRSYGGGGYRSSYSGSGNGSDRRSGSNRYSDRR